jgi:hypothetical protein
MRLLVDFPFLFIQEFLVDLTFGGNFEILSQFVNIGGVLAHNIAFRLSGGRLVDITNRFDGLLLTEAHNLRGKSSLISLYLFHLLEFKFQNLSYLFNVLSNLLFSHRIVKVFDFVVIID